MIVVGECHELVHSPAASVCILRAFIIGALDCLRDGLLTIEAISIESSAALYGTKSSVGQLWLHHASIAGSSSKQRLLNQTTQSHGG